MSALRHVVIALLFALPLFADTLTYKSDSASDFVLRREADRLTLRDRATRELLASAPLMSTRGVVIRGANGAQNDTLTIDLAQPFALDAGIDYDGGADGFDVLNLEGGFATVQRVTQLTPHDGIIDIDGLVIRYTNLEPINDTAPAATLTISGTAGADTVTITNG
ncbi:MAG TPA: hypothetical protein VF608_00175, partial [Thermoanaerobaculia bacterium]